METQIAPMLLEGSGRQGLIKRFDFAYGCGTALLLTRLLHLSRAPYLSPANSYPYRTATLTGFVTRRFIKPVTLTYVRVRGSVSSFPVHTLTAGAGSYS